MGRSFLQRSNWWQGNWPWSGSHWWWNHTAGCWSSALAQGVSAAGWCRRIKDRLGWKCQEADRDPGFCCFFLFHVAMVLPPGPVMVIGKAFDGQPLLVNRSGMGFDQYEATLTTSYFGSKLKLSIRASTTQISELLREPCSSSSYNNQRKKIWKVGICSQSHWIAIDTSKFWVDLEWFSIHQQTIWLPNSCNCRFPWRNPKPRRPRPRQKRVEDCASQLLVSQQTGKQFAEMTSY